MPKLPRLTSKEAETMLSSAGFGLARSKGSHRIYMKGRIRVVIPFHAGRILHPKIVRQVLKAIGNT
ncbi:MAG: type II toxin-antitoxin system HicA family toxin [Candidatus Eremiobacteraeota bacterium]|nr:type II toxin-antitoxin system HicA family toxin [Candidatus Eremiobacteraeota bacterium]